MIRDPARAALLAIAGVLALTACDGPAPAADRLVPDVVRVLPHDPEAFTQGLVLHEGRLYESTGLVGRSSLREVVLETGEVVRIAPLEEPHFGEGLALVGGRLIQLTWLSGLALVYDTATFEVEATFLYDTQGWGLCYDGTSLFMSTGTATLYRRDPDSFAILDTRLVTLRGEPVSSLNALVCVGDHVYANVFPTDRIVKIEAGTGAVVAEIDGSSLVPEGGRPDDPDAVLNGIAHDSRTGTFYLTGKLWPSLFEVRFVPAGRSG